VKTKADYESVRPSNLGLLDSKTADPNNFDSQGKPLKAMARLSVTASSDNVRNLATKIFGARVFFNPPTGVAFQGAEPVMWVCAPYTAQQLDYFTKALDANTSKYKVSYIMPDSTDNTLALKVCFFRGYSPTR
jgi:hypothetical protein